MRVVNRKQFLATITHRTFSCHQILRGSSLRKRHDVANIVGRHEHHQGALNARSYAAMWRSSVGQRVKEKSKSRTRHFISHPEGLEYQRLHVAPMDSYRTTRHFN